MARERQDWNDKPFQLHPVGVGPLTIPVIPNAESLKDAAEKAFVALPESCAKRCALTVTWPHCYLGYMVVSQNKGTPIYNPYLGDPQNGTPDLRKPHIRRLSTGTESHEPPHKP